MGLACRSPPTSQPPGRTAGLALFNVSISGTQAQASNNERCPSPRIAFLSNTYCSLSGSAATRGAVMGNEAITPAKSLDAIQRGSYLSEGGMQGAYVLCRLPTVFFPRGRESVTRLRRHTNGPIASAMPPTNRVHGMSRAVIIVPLSRIAKLTGPDHVPLCAFLLQPIVR